MLKSSQRIFRYWHAGAFLLVVLYCVSFIQPHLPHSESDHVHHDALAEVDPCHRAIYHPGASGACDHKYHFTEGHPDCIACKQVSVFQWPAEVLFFEENFPPVHISFEDYGKYPSLLYHVSTDARGPPVHQRITC